MSDDLSFLGDEPVAKPAPVAKKSARTVPRGDEPKKFELPHSLEAEEYLLSCVMIDSVDMVPRARQAGITSDSFYLSAHKIIWEATIELDAAKQPADVATVAQHLTKHRRLDEVGGYAFLTQVSSRMPTTAQAGYFLKEVRELAARRRLIREAQAITEAVSGGALDFDQLLQDIRERIVRATGVERQRLPARPITAFKLPPKDDRSVLLGNRYLCRGDGGIIVSSSGVGKSSLYVLAAVLWALGRPFFGIRPNGPLKSLLMQSEDTDGDVAEVISSVIAGLQLTEAEVSLVGQRVVVVTDRHHRGDAFLAELRQQIAAFNPDIVWLNPLVAFLDGDMKDAAVTGRFLREGLAGINAEQRFAYVLIHHTTKPPQDRKERNWSEDMYDMAGSFDLIGWARFIINLRPTETKGEFTMSLSKRGARAGVVRQVEQGAGYREDVVTAIPIKHDDQWIDVDGQRIRSVMWLPRELRPKADGDPDDGRARRPERTFSHFRPIFPTSAKPLNAAILLRMAIEFEPTMTKTAFFRLLAQAAEEGLLVRKVDGVGVKYHLPA